MYYYRSPEHSNHYVLSMAFAFDIDEPGEKYYFALCFPYSYSRYFGDLLLESFRYICILITGA